MSNLVLVIDTNKRPLDPVHPGTARHLLNTGKAAVFRRYPFTIILKQAHPDAPVQDLELKLDPGSKTAGIAIEQSNPIICGAELPHRGEPIKEGIKESLLSRPQSRRSRRNRQTRDRQARFLNRTRPQSWLAPSLQHRVDTVLTWVNRVRQLAPLSSMARELVRFDLQRLQNSQISGVEYQQGELHGYEVREYLPYLGRVWCRASGSFDIVTQSGRVAGINHKYCQPIHKKDGYAYGF
jgi:hypothetical protein